MRVTSRGLADPGLDSHRDYLRERWYEDVFQFLCIYGFQCYFDERWGLYRCIRLKL